MTPMPPTSLAEVVAHLYGLAPGAFIKERNGLATQAKSSDRALSDQIKTLPKPALGVWLLNQLARHRPAELGRVLALADALGVAQNDGDGDELRRLSRVRGEVMRETIDAARALGEELGQAISASIAGEVEQAVRAALADQEAARALVSGQLVRPLESTGFGGIDLDGVLAAPGLAPEDVLETPIEPSSEDLGAARTASTARSKQTGSEPVEAPSTDAVAEGDHGPGVVSLAERRAARQAERSRTAHPGDAAADDADAEADAERAAEAEREREEQRQLEAQQRTADQAAEKAAEAARAADQVLADARHAADETADQLEELAALLSKQRDEIRDLEQAARQARRDARDAERRRRHVGILD